MIPHENQNAFGVVLKTEPEKRTLESIDINHEDGSVEVFSNGGGVQGFAFDLFGVSTNEADLIKTYRTMSIQSDFELALNEIRNEIFTFDIPNKKAIDITFSNSEDLKISQKMMESIRTEYDTIYNLLDFQRKGLELFDRWYIDSRLFLQKIINTDKLNDGIQKIVRIDPLKIKKITEYPTPNKNGVYDLSQIKTYFIFSDIFDVHKSTVSRYLVINPDTISYVDSGLYDQNTGMALSYLWKSIVPYNNMKMMEEALIIYRVVRSPERRVFYINVGNLSKPKAESYIQELMNRFKNKLIYDSKTGSVIDRKNVMSMVEDYWLPRRDDNKGTEVQTLPGGNATGTIEDVEHFRKKFLNSLSVPVSRFKDDNTPSFIFGRSSDISRDEYRFKKFLDRLRNRFIIIFEDLLKTQLLLKKIIVDSDWETIKKSIEWEYAEDNNFIQWKEAEVLNNKIETLNSIDNFVGKYFTKKWVMKNVLKMSDDEIEELEQDLKQDLPLEDNA